MLKQNLNHTSHFAHHTSNKGITLIALIITIIVMLILVAVTITMAINGGLFEKAGEAVGETKNEINKEQTLANGQITVNGKVYNSIDEYLEGDTTVLSYNETTKDDNGFLTANATYESNGYTAVIPKGFKVSEVVGETSIATGLVIKDTNNNEFVWIPVNNDLTVAGTDKLMARATSGTDSNNRTNYQGVLYNFSGTTSEEMSDYGQGTNGNREPDVVLYDGSSTDTVGMTLNILQENYNTMINSVKKYQGFYISRYEMGVENGQPISKEGATPTSANNQETKYWYGLYSVAESYNSDAVSSSMIWGSQYDAMLNWALTGIDKEKVTTTGGNQSGSLRNSGETSDDVINNIYDLGGNLYEWTLETSSCLPPEGKAVRTRRGMYYSHESFTPADRSYYGDYYQDRFAINDTNWSGAGTRFTLFF